MWALASSKIALPTFPMPAELSLKEDVEGENAEWENVEGEEIEGEDIEGEDVDILPIKGVDLKRYPLGVGGRLGGSIRDDTPRCLAADVLSWWEMGVETEVRMLDWELICLVSPKSCPSLSNRDRFNERSGSSSPSR